MDFKAIWEFAWEQFMSQMAPNNFHPLYSLALMISLLGMYTSLYLMLPLQPRQAWGLTKIITEVWIVGMSWISSNEEYDSHSQFGGTYYGAKSAVVFSSLLLWDLLYNLDDHGNRQTVLRRHHALTIPLFLRMSIIGYTTFYGSLVYFTQFGIIAEVFYDMMRLEDNKLPRGSYAYMNLMIAGHVFMCFLDMYVAYGIYYAGFYMELFGTVSFTLFHMWVTQQLIRRFRALYYPPYPEMSGDVSKAVALRAKELGVEPVSYYNYAAHNPADPIPIPI